MLAQRQRNEIGQRRKTTNSVTDNHGKSEAKFVNVQMQRKQLKNRQEDRRHLDPYQTPVVKGATEISEHSVEDLTVMGGSDGRFLERNQSVN